MPGRAWQPAAWRLLLAIALSWCQAGGAVVPLAVLHVPKTGGTSLLRELEAHGFQLLKSGELCYPTAFNATAFNIIFLRHPRQHGALPF